MRKYFIYMGIALASLSACNKETPSVAEYAADEIVFTTRASAAETRATGITAVGDGQNGTTALTSFNVIATEGTSKIWDDGVFTGTYGGNYTGGKVWPSTSVNWNFAACNAPMTYAASGSTIAVTGNDITQDIVAAYLTGATYKASNALTFDHIFSQIGTVKMKAPDGYTVSNLKVSIQPIYQGTYNVTAVAGSTPEQKAQGWTRQSAAAAVYLVGTADAGVTLPAYPDAYTSPDNDLWLLPGQYQLTATYTIRKGDYQATGVEKHANITILQGYNNNLGLPGVNADEPNIPIPDDITDIIFTVTVTPWGTTEIPANFN